MATTPKPPNASRSSAELLCLARRTVNLTQEGWALVLGVHVNNVARWERGDVRPSRAALALVREVLKRPVLRRRIWMDRDAERALRRGHLVESIEDSKRIWQGMGAFLVEAELIDPARGAA